ncbi:uncharacterized protein PHALS_04118 [Plasmopara halstedii]|uniref:Uncharacterized protein n=1 Tax=Plasmopara halstedii TaxID=4781 RepID=A0A0P1A9U3_PLAHL|nr:uncharacterized protein PHALS_04118 [Plasmopara halstedii]CEG36865.1 hypothetical protein PHALS_04118 [Plasmopara halstedii]|eukprot:XP_024573234.1 hypothetical protein PHALS_04118 [Plasmopara halstedii]
MELVLVSPIEQCRDFHLADSLEFLRSKLLMTMARCIGYNGSDWLDAFVAV